MGVGVAEEEAIQYDATRKPRNSSYLTSRFGALSSNGPPPCRRDIYQKWWTIGGYSYKIRPVFLVASAHVHLQCQRG